MFYLSIIIVNYQSQQYLEKCLKSIFEKIKNISFEIIVVNNDSTENLANIPQKYSGIKIINSSKNIGFGAANNLGAREAKGKILFFLNPDTQVKSENIQEVLTLFHKDNSLGIIGGKVLTPDKTVQNWTHGPRMNIFNLLRNNLLINHKINYMISQETDWVSGTAFFISKKLFQELNGFDEKFFMYFEDMDLGLRTHLTGKKVLYYPNFVVIHASGQSYKNKKTQKNDYYTSQEYYFKKHRPGFEYWIIRFIRKFFFS